MIKKEVQFIFYLYLHSKLAEATDNSYLTIAEAKWKMFQWRIPEIIRSPMLKEMELLGLLTFENTRLLKLEKSKFNINNINYYCQKLGIY